MRFLILSSILIIFLLTSPAWSQTTDLTTVPNAPNMICPLLIGSPVPQITLKNLAAESVDLHAKLKLKPTILIYFRGGW